MQNDKDFNSEDMRINDATPADGADRTFEDRTSTAEFDAISESISNRIDEAAADVMEEAIKEIREDGGEANTALENSKSSDYDVGAGNMQTNGAKSEGVYGINNGGSMSGQAYSGGNAQRPAGTQQYGQYPPHTQGYNYNMPQYFPPYGGYVPNGYPNTQSINQPNGAYPQQPYAQPAPNQYGVYGPYGYYMPQYPQQPGAQQGYAGYQQNTFQQGVNAQPQQNQQHTGQSGRDRASQNYAASGQNKNPGVYGQNTAPYYGYPYQYQPNGYYGQPYQAPGYNTGTAGAAAVNRSTQQRSRVKKQKPKNIGLRVFVCMLAVVILAGIALTSAYFLFPSDDGNILENYPETSHSNEPTIEASVPSETYGGGQSIDVPLSGLPDAERLSTEEIAEKTLPSVVGIAVYSQLSESQVSWATGIIITEDGYIVTNDHIYDGIPGAEFIVITSDNKRYDADFVAGDSRSDLAVLKMEQASGLTAAEFGDSGSVQVGEEVVVIGNPYSMTLSGSVTKGIISATGRRITGNSTYTMKLIQTDAAINPGNSGGPLVNSYGQIIGVNSSKIQQSGYEGIGFAIPSSTVKTVVESLIENGYVTGRAKLGVTFQVVDFLTEELSGLPQGLYVLSVSDESGLSGKISEGEIITHLDGMSLSETADFMDIIEAKQPGDSIGIRVYNTNTGTSRDISAVLTEDRGASSYTAAY